MDTAVKVRLLGVFQTLSGRKELIIKVEEPMVIETIIQKLVELSPPEFEKILIDQDLKDPRPNAIILVNGRGISVLNGLETEVNDGDEITIIPVSHGG